MNLGPTELGIVLVIVMVVFGGARLPQLARSLGEARRELEAAGEGAPAAVPVTAPVAALAPDVEHLL